MTVDNLITLLRDQSQTTTSNVDATTILRYVNIAYHTVENEICEKVNEDYFWDIFTTSTVADQNEYVLQANSSTVVGVKKVNRVEVKRKTADEYMEVLRADAIQNYKTSDARLQANASNPFYEFREGSIFLYPTPTESVTNWLKIYWVKSLIDLVAWSAETTIFPNHSELRQFHQIVALGAIPYVLRHRNVDTSLVNNAQIQYENELYKMITVLNSKYNDPQEILLPSWEYYY